MLKIYKMIYVVTSAALSFFTNTNYAATPILASVILANNTSELWSHFDFTYQTGYPAQYQVHISPENGPQKGNVIFILPANQAATFALSFNANESTTKFCAINISITSDNTANIFATPINSEVPYTCSFTPESKGEPAKLIIQQKGEMH